VKDTDPRIRRAAERLQEGSTHAHPDADPPPGERAVVGRAIDRYVVVDELGKGGMGVVYKAYDPDLRRLVAVKLLRAGVAGGRHALRLEREARAIARLAHPNVVAIHDVGMFGSELFVAMEYVEGDSLRRWLAVGTRPLHAVLDVFLQAAHGLAAAHDAGLVHRDFKPDNVLVGDDGRVRVLDFGLARAARASEDQGDEDVDLESGVDIDAVDHLPLDRSLTPTGHAVGTPQYMAPEQHRDEDIDGRADQYAWAVVLYQALTNQRPFDAIEYKDLRRLVLTGQSRPFPPAAAVPRWIERLIRRAMSVERDQRYPSMHDIIAELTEDREALRRAALDGSADLEAMIAAFPPVDAIAAEVRRLRAVLEEAWDQKSRGALEPAMDQALRVAADAERIDYAPLRAASLYLVGNLEHRMGNAVTARGTLFAAARAAASAGDDWQIANTWVFLVLVLGTGLGRTDEAEAIAEVAEVALARVGENASLRSRLYNYRAASLSSAGRHPEAAAVLEKAVVLDEKTHGPVHWFVVVSLLNLVETWLDADQPARARPPLERAVAICRPDDDPPTASRTRCLALAGRTLVAEGNLPAAEILLARAVGLWERLPGRGRALADALVDLARCRRLRGETAGARERLDEAAAVLRKNPDRRVHARMREERGLLDRGTGG
jgi:tetratricopeptide (TPR) repeat protein/predicted Ser/Thr protein kinase